MKRKYNLKSQKKIKQIKNKTKKRIGGTGSNIPNYTSNVLARLSTNKLGVISPKLDDKSRTIKTIDVTSGRDVSFQMPRNKYSKIKTIFYQFLNQNIQDGILKPKDVPCPDGFEIDHSMDHCLIRLGLKADFCISENQVRSVSVQVQPSTLKSQPSILDADHGVPRGEVTYNTNRIQEFIDNQQGNVFHFTNEEGQDGAILVEIRSGPFFEPRGYYKFQSFLPFALCPCEKTNEGKIKGVNREAFQYIPNVRIDNEYVLFPLYFLPYEDFLPNEGRTGANLNKTSQFVLERTDIAFSHMANSLIVTEAKSEENMSDISELPNCEDNTRGRVYLPRVKGSKEKVPKFNMDERTRTITYGELYRRSKGHRDINTVPSFWFNQKFKSEAGIKNIPN